VRSGERKALDVVGVRKEVERREHVDPVAGRFELREVARKRAGISDALVRLSVGIEDAADLTRDLAQALDAAQAVAG